jgi:hypothetical protein
MKVVFAALMLLTMSSSAMAIDNLELFTCQADYVWWNVGYSVHRSVVRQTNGATARIVRERPGHLDLLVSGPEGSVTGGEISLDPTWVKKFDAKEIRAKETGWWGTHELAIDVVAGTGKFVDQGKRATFGMHKDRQELKLSNCVANLPNLETVAREISAN